jgi:hypothetical protein
MADASLNNVVEVNVTIDAPVRSEIDFQLCNLFQTDTSIIPLSERFRIYENATAVAADFSGATDNEKYVRACADVYFGQEGETPAELMITTVDLGGGETYDQIAASVYNERTYVMGVIADIDATAVTLAVVQAIELATADLPVIFFYLRDSATIQAEGPTLVAANSSRIAYMEGDLPVDLTTASRVEMALIGKCIGRQIGSVNWALQPLTGVSPTSLSIATQDQMLSLKSNIYGILGGVAVTRLGTVMSNAAPFYIDEQRAIDYLKNQLQVGVYSALVGGDIPYTVRGFNLISHEISSVLTRLSSDGVIDANFTVVAPNPADATPTERADRQTPPFEIRASLQGFILKVIINASLVQ